MRLEQHDIIPWTLDVGSDPSALRSMAAPGLSLGLTDPRPSGIKRIDRSEFRDMVTGDILASSTWRTLRRTMRCYQIPHFELIMAAPENGGLMNITSESSVHAIVLNKLWQILSPNGLMVIQLVTRNGLDVLSLGAMGRGQWDEYFGTLTGVDAHFTETALVISRTPDAPHILPAPTIIESPTVTSTEL